MTRPIKISDELYGRLKDQAKAQGLTLQDALVELIATPHEGLARLGDEMQAQRLAASSSGKAQAALSSDLGGLRNEVEALREQVDRLTKLRDQDIKVFNEWVEIWNHIEPLESRASSLERRAHEHWWQVAEEE